jgi:hypothetical protein
VASKRERLLLTREKLISKLMLPMLVRKTPLNRQLKEKLCKKKDKLKPKLLNRVEMWLTHNLKLKVQAKKKF